VRKGVSNQKPSVWIFAGNTDWKTSNRHELYNAVNKHLQGDFVWFLIRLEGQILKTLSECLKHEKHLVTIILQTHQLTIKVLQNRQNKSIWSLLSWNVWEISTTLMVGSHVFFSSACHGLYIVFVQLLDWFQTINFSSRLYAAVNYGFLVGVS